MVGFTQRVTVYGILERFASLNAVDLRVFFFLFWSLFSSE